jgi:hypothetical protein
MLAAPPPCTTAQFLFSVGPEVEPPSQSDDLTMRLRNTDRSACEMRGYLRLTFLGRNGRPLPIVVRHHGAPQVSEQAPGTVVVRPGGYAYVLLARWACADDPIGDATRMRVALPGSSTARTMPVLEGFGLDWCARGDPEFRVIDSAVASSMRGVAAFWHHS